jgi:hypothetical protein
MRERFAAFFGDDVHRVLGQFQRAAKHAHSRARAREEDRRGAAVGHPFFQALPDWSAGT